MVKRIEYFSISTILHAPLLIWIIYDGKTFRQSKMYCPSFYSSCELLWQRGKFIGSWRTAILIWLLRVTGLLGSLRHILTQFVTCVTKNGSRVKCSICYVVARGTASFYPNIVGLNGFNRNLWVCYREFAKAGAHPENIQRKRLREWCNTVININIYKNNVIKIF